MTNDQKYELIHQAVVRTTDPAKLDSLQALEDRLMHKGEDVPDSEILAVTGGKN